jgi:serine/threonine protein kinase
MSRTDCPDVRNWQALLEGERNEGELEGLAHHLETCSDCRQTLESLAAAPAVWEDTACALGEQRGKTGQEPALRQIVERLKREEALAPEADLSFLQPTDNSELLGLLGPYHVQEVVGRGGMGLVLKAFDPTLHRLVAIKVLDPALAGNATSRRRFLREAQAAAAVCHDHVVAVHAVCESDGFPYMVVQFIAGESLQSRLDHTGPLETTEVVRIGLQTASGLAAAHAQGLIHRDIKPANLLLEDGLARVKITDFGLARMADDVGLTQNGVVAGTPEYMAPEQARGEVVDQRADLFSLGSVLYACCTGVPPFRGSTALAVLSQVSEKEPSPIRSLNPDVPAWLETFIARLMAKDPAQRFQSAAEVAALLEGYLAHLRQPTSAPIPELPISLRTRRSGPSFFRIRTGNFKQYRKYVWVSVLVCLGMLGLMLFPLAQVVPPEQQPPPSGPGLREFYQDFRGSKAVNSQLRLWSADDLNAITRFEAEGLRVTMPAGRPVTWPVEVRTSFAISGDFEVTASYELLSAARPTKGYGVGVTLNIADHGDRNKFAKMSRSVLPKKGSVFHSQFWVNSPRHADQERTKPTLSRIGQLRLLRKGTVLQGLAADGLEGNFEEILTIKQFGTENMNSVLLGVMDSGGPGFAVDARLLDFRVRASNFVPKPDATSQGIDFPTTSEPERKSGPKSWLAALGIMVLLSFAILVVCLLVRRRRAVDSLQSASIPDGEIQLKPAAPSISMRCSGCEKTLKAKPELAGKKVKCPQCGQVVQVPAIKTAGG